MTTPQDTWFARILRNRGVSTGHPASDPPANTPPDTRKPDPPDCEKTKYRPMPEWMKAQDPVAAYFAREADIDEKEDH